MNFELKIKWHLFKFSIPMKVFRYGIDRLTVKSSLRIARGKIQAVLDPSVIQRIQQSHQIVKDVANRPDVVYGINSGFGPLCTTRISPQETKILQYNILKSHSVGVGEAIPPEIAKLMMITKVHALAQGYSGISLKTLNRIIWHIDQDIIPLVPAQGSVGASGDLAPLAHLFMPLIGLGQVYFNDQKIAASSLFDKLGVHPIELQPKEGLALINGTQFMLAFGIKNL